MDKQSGHSPNGGEHKRRVQVQRNGSGRKVLLQVYQGGNASLLLPGPPEDERQSRGAVRLDIVNDSQMIKTGAW